MLSSANELVVAGSPNTPKKRSKEIGYPGPLVLALIWAFVGTVAYARHYLQAATAGQPTKTFFEWLSWQTCFYPWIAFSPLVFRLERKYPLQSTRWPLNFLRLAAVCMPVSYLCTQMAQGLSIGVRFLFHEPITIERPLWIPNQGELWIQTFIYWSTVVGAYVIRCLIQLHQREKEAAKLALEKAELESSLRQAELETLRMRLNPHFLFNCLQNIAVLTQEDPKTASQMLTRLGDLLRTALRRESSAEMTLASEIALTRSYVAIEKMRFEDRLSILFDISPASEQALVPAFLLQPLVENAILHGLRGVQRDGVISIRSAIESDHLVIVIIDNGIGLAGKDAANLDPGVGLTSTCERLEKMYPQQHSFSIRPLPEGGTEVRVTLPLRLENPPLGVMAYEQPAPVNR